MSPTPATVRLRWLVLAIFVLSSAINYLDRQTLAALAPLLQHEFQLTREQYGWILGAFSATYAVSAPLAGAFIDRIGLNRGISLAVAVWSCAGIATGFTTGLRGLIGCRVVLGIAESGGVPAAGKAIHQYLRASERALGNAFNQAGVSLGAMLAPPLAAWFAATRGWRLAFVTTGVLGLLWIPVWNWSARLAGAAPSPKPESGAGRSLLRDRRLWAFVLANALGMVAYSLWTNWTTQYLVDEHHLTLSESAWYAWIPPVFALAGGFAGGWLSRRLMDRGLDAPAARFRVCLTAAVLALSAFAIPAASTPGLASAGISLSIFAVAAFSVNMYSLPLDAFGSARAAFAVSMLVASYGALQFLISPVFGRLADLHNWTALSAIAALTPLAACAVLFAARSVE
ncbi:MAG TPA: MFS transporter [Bryobacteraceae bacterium]|nr:MFS transporter [Bryobacteraceae bacterium]